MRFKHFESLFKPPMSLWQNCDVVVFQTLTSAQVIPVRMGERVSMTSTVIPVIVRRDIQGTIVKQVGSIYDMVSNHCLPLLDLL